MSTIARPKHVTVRKERLIGDRMEFTLRYPTEKFKQASCADIDVELFYPNRDALTPDEKVLFKRMCGACPIKDACLEWALAHEHYGIWANTTPAERSVMRAKLKWMVNDFFSHSIMKR
jgi:hypothetical protein